MLQEVKEKVFKYLDTKDKLSCAKNTAHEDGGSGGKIDPRFFSILATLASSLGAGDPCIALQKFSNGLCRAQRSNLSKDAATYSQPLTHDLIVQNSTLEVGNQDIPQQLTKMRTYNSELHLKSDKVLDLKKDRREGQDRVCRIMLLFAEDGVEDADRVYNIIQDMEFKVIIIIPVFVNVKRFLQMSTRSFLFSKQ